jgi:hypothetical protein
MTDVLPCPRRPNRLFSSTFLLLKFHSVRCFHCLQLYLLYFCCTKGIEPYGDSIDLVESILGLPTTLAKVAVYPAVVALLIALVAALEKESPRDYGKYRPVV